VRAFFAAPKSGIIGAHKKAPVKGAGWLR